MDYGKILRKRREELGLTQAELSRLSGIDQTVISRIETGQKRIVTPQAEKVIAALLLELMFVKVGKKKIKR